MNVCGFPEADTIVDFLLRSGRALLLWDALDEVATDDDQRSTLVAEMHDFMRKYDKCQDVISCRIAAADYTFHERRLRYVKMAPFSDNQIERYLERWFGDKTELAADAFTELQEERHQGLRELARTPILLTLLAIAYEETLSFPSRRVDIYYQAIEALLRKWDADRGIRRGQEVYAGLELGYKWDLMTEVAADAFNNGEYLLTRQEWGERIRDFLEALPDISPGVDGGLVLDSMAERHGLFVQQTPRLYSLPHLSFQEYFTARDIKENIQHSSLDRLLDHVGEDQWREIFLLTASSLRRKDAANFFDLFVTRLDRTVANILPIQQHLGWAQWKAEMAVVHMKPAYRLISLRAWYLALAPVRSYADDARSLASALDRVRVFARILDPALDRALALDSALDLVLERTLDFNINSALDSTLVRALDSARTLAFDSALDGVKKRSEGFGFGELRGALDKLIIPSEDAPREEWTAFENRLVETVEAFRDFSGVRYLQQADEQDEKRLAKIYRNTRSAEIYANYLRGTALLIDCLALVTVANRREIEERLLLPANST